MRKKFLLLIGGESFRSGGQGSRIIGREDSVEDQIRATQSQVKLIQTIQEKYNLDVSVGLMTTTTCYNNILLELFKDNIVYNYFFERNAGHTENIRALLKQFSENNSLDTFESCLYTRVDLKLKDTFFDIYNPLERKLMFPFFTGDPRTSRYIQVNNMFVHFTPEHIKKVSNIDNIYFTCLMNWNYYEFIQPSNTTALIYTSHSSNSQACWNPIYEIANRPITNRWVQPLQTVFYNDSEQRIQHHNIKIPNEVLMLRRSSVLEYNYKLFNMIHSFGKEYETNL